MRAVLQRIAATLRRRRADDRLDDEIRAHLDLLTAEYERRGMTPEQVADATLRAIERGVREVTFTGRGKLFVLASRLFPRVVDRIAARRVRQLYVDESAPD